MAGQQENRFRTHLHGADPDPIERASVEWHRCSELLQVVARSLLTAAERDEEIGGRTGPAMGAAFHRASDSMEHKARLLTMGGDSLGRSGRVITNALEARTDLDTKSEFEPVADPGPYQPPVGPPTPEDIRDRTDHGTRVREHHKRVAAREDVSRRWADRIDEVFTHEIEVMKRIHGVGRRRRGLHDDPGLPEVPETPVMTVCPPPPREPIVVVCGPWPTHEPEVPETETEVVEPEPEPEVDPEVEPPTVTHPPVDPTGTPQGPGAEVPPRSGSTPALPAGPPSASPGVSASGVSAGLGAGVLGTAGVAAIARGAVPLPTVSTGPTAPGTPSAAAAIGSSARTVGTASSTGALGRGGLAGAVPGTAARASGTRAGRAGARSAASRGAAGARGAAAGGVGAARGRRRREQEGRDRDLFDDGRDWIDDEGAAPEVLD